MTIKYADNMFMVWGVTLPAATIGYFIDTVRELVGDAGGWPSNWSAFVNGIKLSQSVPEKHTD